MPDLEHDPEEQRGGGHRLKHLQLMPSMREEHQHRDDEPEHEPCPEGVETSHVTSSMGASKPETIMAIGAPRSAEGQGHPARAHRLRLLLLGPWGQPFKRALDRGP